MVRSTILIGLAAVAAATASLPPFEAGAQAAASPPVRANGPDDPSGLQALRERDQRVAEVGFRLRAANKDHCPMVGPLPGWTLHNAAQYAVRIRSLASAHFRLVGDFPSLLAVAPNSPAWSAGLRSDDVLLSVNERPLGSFTSVDGEASFDSLAQAAALLEHELARPATLQILRYGERLQITMPAGRGCLIESQVDPSSELQAEANAQRVFITTAMVDFAGADDELAFVLAHEYAHIILGHAPPAPGGEEAPLAAPVSPRASALSEVEELAADRLGLSLVHNAGFKVGAAPALIERLGRERRRLSAWPSGSRWTDRRRVALEQAASQIERGAGAHGESR